MKKGLLVQDHTYSDEIYNKKILICAPPLPPPYGGISMHLQSVTHKFEKQGNTVFHHNTLAQHRYRYFFWYLLQLIYKLRCIRPDIIYYHTLSLPNSAGELRLLSIFKRIFHYTLVTVDHDCLHLLKRPVNFRKKLNKLVSSIDWQVLIGDSTYQSYCDTNIAAARKVSVERAFIPPAACSVQAAVPAAIESFCARHTPIITVAITRLIFMDGRDLYGGDTAIEVLKNMRAEFPTAGLICLIGAIDEQQYYEQLRERLLQYGLQDAVCLLQGIHPLWPLLRKTDLFLRPTLCDGASVSEDEAHYLGIPVVASDVCVRHIKTVTYASGSVADCSMKVSKVLAHGIQKQTQL